MIKNKKLEKLIKQHSFDFNLKLFSEENTLVDLALQTGENTAKVETLTENHEEVADKVDSIQRGQQWNDESISRLYDRVNALEVKYEEVKNEEIETVEEIEENNEGGGNTEIVEEVNNQPETKSNEWGTMVGTAIFGAVIVFLIKLFESKKGGEKEE